MLRNKGFTLVELLVVISIISFLSSVVITNVNNARIASRDVLRIQNIRTLQTVLEAYYADNGLYPKTFNVGSPLIKYAECLANPNDYIPNVTPVYISVLPSDPALDCASTAHSWSYASNGIDYKLITHIEGNFFGQRFIDPAWDGGPDPCVLDGASAYHYGIWTEGAACWSI